MMDRKIKFRVWLKDRRKMGYSYNYNCLYDFFQDYGWKYHSPTPPEDNYVLMQYAGMQDKNDQDIYEGDIMEWNDKKSLIVFKGGETNDLTGWSQFMGFVPKIIYDGAMKSFQMSKAKIIGNKFEDPELLDK